jgi:hypothetical protein
MAFSHDGESAVYTSIYNLHLGSAETWTTHTATGDTIAYTRGVGTLGVYVSPDDRFVLLVGGQLLMILTFPELDAVYVDSLVTWGAAFHPTKRRVFACFERAFDSLFVVDFAELPPAITSIPIRTSNGEALQIRGVHEVTNKYIVLGSHSHGGYLQLYDTETLSLVREARSVYYVGSALHPDGNRLFLTYNGGFENPLESGIDIYYMNTGALLPFITPEEAACCYDGLAPDAIEMLPTGESFFVLDGASGWKRGPVLQIDASSKEIVRVMSPKYGTPRLIALNPKNWRE